MSSLFGLQRSICHVSVFLHEGIGTVVVDAFEILRFHGEPGDVFICHEPFRNLPDDVLHEHGVLKGPFSDVLFIRAFKDGIDVTTGAALYQVDDVLNPDESFETEMDDHQRRDRPDKRLVKYESCPLCPSFGCGFPHY